MCYAMPEKRFAIPQRIFCLTPQPHQAPVEPYGFNTILFPTDYHKLSPRRQLALLHGGGSKKPQLSTKKDIGLRSRWRELKLAPPRICTRAIKHSASHKPVWLAVDSKPVSTLREDRPLLLDLPMCRISVFYPYASSYETTVPRSYFPSGENSRIGRLRDSGK